MDDKVTKRKATERPTRVEISGELPRLPENFSGGQYANRVEITATDEEIFFDLFQIGPEAGGHAEGHAVFVNRFVIPIQHAKSLVVKLKGMIEKIEEDTNRKIPGPDIS